MSPQWTKSNVVIRDDLNQLKQMLYGRIICYFGNSDTKKNSN